MTTTIYPAGTLLLDSGTGITYRARKPHYDIKLDADAQDFSIGYAEGQFGLYSTDREGNLPETAVVIWTPEA